MKERSLENDQEFFKPPPVGVQLHNKEPNFYESRNLLSSKELVDKVLQFCMIFSGKNWYTYQKAFARRIIEAVVLNEGEIITGLWSRQSGKTDAIANASIGMAILLPTLANHVYPDDERLMVFKNGFYVGIFAPIQEQADISHNRIRALLDSEMTEPFLQECSCEVLTNRGGNVALSNGSYIHSRSASPDSKIEGKTYHLAIIEEAQLVSRYKVNKEIAPMLSSTNGILVKIGTAHMSKGGFHNSIQYNVALYKNKGKRNHFEFPYDLVIKEKTQAYKRDGNMFHLQYERWIQKEIQRLGGTESEEFQMNFALNWKESKKLALSEGTITSLANPLLESNIYTREGYQVAGIDVAKSGDETVITIMRAWKDVPIFEQGSMFEQASEDYYYKKTILGWLALQGDFEGNDGQYQMTVNYLKMWGIKRVVIDATGMGDPIAERLRVLLPRSIEVIPFKYSLSSKSDLYKYYLPEFISRRIEYPAGPHTVETNEFKNFQKQHINLDREYNGEYLVIEGAEGEHDDYPNSSALACWGTKSGNDLPDIEVEHGSKRAGKSEIAKWNSASSIMGMSRTSRYRKRW